MLLTLPAHAQLDSLGGLTGKFSRYQRAALPEKLFLHLDRPVYSVGETMWFKVYAVDGTYSKPLPLSTVAYVEVLNAERQPVLQATVALRQATGHGSFQLPGGLASGSYTVRAYTSWMQNFGPEYFFQTTVSILNGFAASAPVPTADSAAVDVQFFAEGGTLVRGLRNRVAFKVTGRHGRGLAASGRILDRQGQVVGTCQTLRFGMGSFELRPVTDGPYSALITLADKRIVRQVLPPVAEQGYVLRLESTSPSQLTLHVESTNNQSETLALLVHARQQIAVATQALLQGGRASFVIDKARLLPGIVHFTVFDSRQQPLAERLYFQRPAAADFLTAHPDKSQYGSREKVAVQLTTTAPAVNLSIAVYRLDSLNTAPSPGIAAYLNLSADLRGFVENPDYYLNTSDPAAEAATDNLMLTQGWSRFRWAEVQAAYPPAFAHLPELNGPTIRVQLTQAGTDQPRPGLTAYLSSPSRLIRLTNGLSDANGIVRFELPELAGERDLILQADLRQDSTCQLRLLSPFSPRYAQVPMPALGLAARWQADYARRHFQAQVQQAYAAPAALSTPKALADSTAFYGLADETYLLDKYTRFKVMEEVLREYVPGVMVRIRKDGFRLMVLNKLTKIPFEESPLVLMDGVPVFDINKLMAVNPLKIRKLEVVDGRYFHGHTVYPGIISFSTYKGDLEGFPLSAHALLQQYEGVQEQREFYAPRYETALEKQSRRPDLRNLLYWNPEFTLPATAPHTLEFYTGDQAGRYQAVIQGLTADGQATSQSFIFEVKTPL
ncbi:hypothetical protein Q5H93_10190 [Hymenobacter sp. ASUV-10]|uniref:Macroglobulin domain-containing protein n=1 Tax=Hymenobacter aranciens TaxID=3063996 RepID=A0ABT9BA09_9BACT|nr:hypothetical protein [Hymenobacter sp. ASUV-10]MDO7875100.1 hypothetical protein [Hymenobacter sp. ASUV-10]